MSIKEDHGSDGSLLSINDINDQQGRTNRKKFDRQNNDDDDIAIINDGKDIMERKCDDVG